jgi:plastocyanin
MYHLMYKSRRFILVLLASAGLTVLLLLLTKFSAQNIQAAPAAVTVELVTTGDARIQGGSPDVNFSSGYLYLATLNGHFVFTQFDLLALPADATIDTAELQLNFTSILTGPNDVEVGRALDPWDETTLTWNNQPGITWGGPVQTVSANGIYSWDVTQLVAQWQDGTVPNYGFALRGNGGSQVVADSKETGGPPPTLVVTYSVPPPEGARPDLGDAPDSSNHLGLNNTAYNVGGVLGRFPTVWDVPAGQVAGPRHDNLTGEGILGDYLSSEIEADIGPDQDGANNILDGGADNANNDRGDDGWRNRNIKFFDCRKQTLTIRVTKAPAATLDTMYLNVWFDGNRDGDWADIASCEDPNGGPAQASYEWIVQDYIVDMTAIPAGGYLDIPVNTERVLNSTPGKPHWMRFTLSEERTVQPPGGGYPDGRGPHPDGALGSYQFGETEDVFQLPPPPGEDGTLVLEKQVLNASSPVDYAGTVTYKIRLRHEGGTQPIEAEIRDEVVYPQHVLPQLTGSGTLVVVDVTSPTGGASPLQANLTSDFSTSSFKEIVSWQGTLAPNSEVVLSFDVHVHPFCGVLQQTETIHNVAQARPIGGSEITAEASFTAQCPGYSTDDVIIRWDDPISHTIDLSDYKDIVTNASVQNQHPITITLALTGELETNVPNLGVVELPGVRKITLGPNETQTIDFALPLSDLVTGELALPEEFSAVGRLNYCFVVDGPYTFDGQNPGCPDAQLYPNLVGQGDPITITVRPNDLGDAPDSTNHFAVAMTAYPGVPATFPTVFDPAAGLPQGPKHLHPRPLHLGQQVSREAEADVGPDADPLNNIEPPANNPDNDRFDDGVNPNLWALTNCQTTTIPVQVFISPQAVNWFQQQEKLAYLNVWLDANRDGDWADGFNCGVNQAEVEHIVIDYPVDVVALGMGLQVINVPTGLVPWPAQWADQPFWARVTLSEEKSNQTLLFGGISYSDGRGWATPFRTGETEDYLAFPQGAGDAGPDVAVELAGQADWDLTQQPGNLAAPAAVNATEQIRFKINYANLGSRPADGAVLTFQIPTELQGLQPAVLQAPGIPAADITHDNDHISFLLPYLEQENLHIVLGWERDAGSGQPDTYSASAEVTLNGDVDLSNNQAMTTVTTTPPAPTIAARVADDQGWGRAETSCRSDIELGILGIPGQAVTIFVDGQAVDTALLGEEPVYYPLQNLSQGPHHIEAYYSAWLTAVPNLLSPRDAASGLATGVIINVDPSLPIDPLSLSFTDSQGHSYHPPTLGWSWGATQTGTFLKAGETYKVGLDSCSDELNQRVEMIIAVLIGLLRDDDGDGRYTGTFTYNPAPPTATAAATGDTLSFRVINGGVEQSFGMAVEPLVSGTVRDAFSSQPLAGAAVTVADGTSNTMLAFSPWPDAALGQSNPQITGADGGYSFNVPGGLNRLEVLLAGFQPYRSWNVYSPNGLLAEDVALTPELGGTAVSTIHITDNGFDPAILTVPPGSIIEWINASLNEHTATGISGDSGALSSGQSYRTRLDTPGNHSYTDNANPLNTATIIVEESRIFLPIVIR